MKTSNNTTKRIIGVLFAAVLGVACSCPSAQAQIINGSFETGDFTGWTTQDLADPLNALTVRTNGYNEGYGLFSTQATNGSYVATTGFDGAGPGTISISQNIGLLTSSADLLTFDYRAGWDMLDYAGSTLNRTFDLVLSPSGGGSPLATFNVLTAYAGTKNPDTGAFTSQLNLSAFIGDNVNISFQWYVPQDFTGPAFAQLDNVQLSAASAPEPSIWALLLGGLGLLAFWRTRTRSARI
jgi:MYXO-CTERM domain-containing protein